jgi:hypothetical protein
MIYFPETIIQWGIFSLQLYYTIAVQCAITLTLCITVSWSCGESVSRLGGHAATSLLPHCLEPTAAPFPFLGGPGPPVPKMASLSPGSTHTPSSLSVTLSLYSTARFLNKYDNWCFCISAGIVPSHSILDRQKLFVTNCGQQMKGPINSYWRGGAGVGEGPTLGPKKTKIMREKTCRTLFWHIYQQTFF